LDKIFHRDVLSLYNGGIKEVKISFDPVWKTITRRGMRTAKGFMHAANFTIPMDRIAREIREERGIGEIEWSVDHDGVLSPYQWRPSRIVDYSNKPVSIGNSPKEMIIEGNIVLGHGELIAPIVAMRDFQTVQGLGAYGEAMKRKYGSGGYILLGNLAGLLHAFGFQPTARSAYEIFPSMIGFINIGTEQLPLGAHWIEFFIRRNVLVITVPEISPKGEARLRSTLDPQYSTEKRFCFSPARMAVDANAQMGEACIL